MLHSVSAALRKPNLAKIHQRIFWSLVCPWNPLNPKPHKFSSRPPSDDFFIQCCFFHAETLRNLPCMKKWSDGGLAENVGGGSAAPQGPYDEILPNFHRTWSCKTSESQNFNNSGMPLDECAPASHSKDWHTNLSGKLPRTAA